MADGGGGTWKTARNRSSSLGSPLSWTLPPATASLGPITPASRARSSGPVSMTRSGSAAGPGATSRAPSSMRAWTAMSPTRSS